MKDVCKPDTFQGFPNGTIALIQEGAPCDLFTIAQAAEHAGAAALLLYNRPTTKYLSGARVRVAAWKEGVSLSRHFRYIVFLFNLRGCG